MAPRTRYARSGDTNIAYQVVGDGPVDIVFVTGLISHIEHLWEEPGLVRLFERQAQFSRLILMDRRGMGLSDPSPGAVSLEEEVEDLAAVLDAVGSERAALHGHNTGGAFVIQFAAKHPERVTALILYATFARSTRSEELPWLDTPAERDARNQQWFDAWGEGANIAAIAPSAATDERLRAWLARLERLAAGPGAMAELSRRVGELDVTPLLTELRVPTLVMHRRDDRMIDPRHATYLAERIPGSRLVWLAGEDNLPTLGDTDAFVDEIEEFLTGDRHARDERELLTVLFTDICDGTRLASRLGDRRWRDLLAAHDGVVRKEIARYEGQVVKSVGDGFLAVFAGAPSDAVRSARAIVRTTGDLGVMVRCGLHTGECELIGDDIGGMAVHIAARVSGLADPGEVLASGTTYGTVVGSGLEWADRGSQVLRGVPGHWPLFALQL